MRYGKYKNILLKINIVRLSLCALGNSFNHIQYTLYYLKNVGIYLFFVLRVSGRLGAVLVAHVVVIVLQN